jgi:hypothetical protein
MPVSETFWGQVATFNEVTFPVQIFLLVLAVVLTFLVVFRSGDVTDILMKTFLALAFVWNGIVFFWIFTWSIPSVVFCAFFIIVALLFITDIFVKKTRFQFPSRGRGRQVVTIVLLLVVFLYPLFGVALGRYYPGNLMPMFPSPLVLFTIALLTAALPHVDRKVYIVLLIMAIFGFPGCFGLLGCYEDGILFIAGLYGLVALINYWSIISKRQRFFR